MNVVSILKREWRPLGRSENRNEVVELKCLNSTDRDREEDDGQLLYFLQARNQVDIRISGFPASTIRYP